MSKAGRIAWFTLQDQLQRKSFYVLLAAAMLFVFTLRGCYDANYMINNRPVAGVTVAWHASLFAFQLIAFAMLIMAVLLAMAVFPHDAQDGTMILYLARPLSRRAYVLGRITGLWLLASIFMLALHGTVLLIAWQKTGAFIPDYLAASLVCCVNLFFAIVLTALLSFLVPGFMTAFIALAIICFGYLSDSGIRFLHNPMVQTVFTDGPTPEPARWRLLYPKLAMVQHYAATIISHDPFRAIGPVHPLVNVLTYSAVLVWVLLLVFDHCEI
jgi:ABC-type transport system involved in multi-copper enzyme maturation permease subunit